MKVNNIYMDCSNGDWNILYKYITHKHTKVMTQPSQNPLHAMSSWMPHPTPPPVQKLPGAHLIACI